MYSVDYCISSDLSFRRPLEALTKIILSDYHFVVFDSFVSLCVKGAHERPDLPAFQASFRFQFITFSFFLRPFC